jgi:nucleotide-binding universal stress UspA family protein
MRTAAWPISIRPGTTYLEGIVNRLRRVGVMADPEVRQARNVADAIAAAAEEGSADLIVMSTQALTGPARALLGSVADAVVRSARCPVFLTYPADRSTRGQPLTPVEPGREADVPSEPPP